MAQRRRTAMNSIRRIFFAVRVVARGFRLDDGSQRADEMLPVSRSQTSQVTVLRHGNAACCGSYVTPSASTRSLQTRDPIDRQHKISRRRTSALLIPPFPPTFFLPSSLLLSRNWLFFQRSTRFFPISSLTDCRFSSTAALKPCLFSSLALLFA